MASIQIICEMKSEAWIELLAVYCHKNKRKFYLAYDSLK